MLLFRKLNSETEKLIGWAPQEITPLLPAPDFAAGTLSAGGTVFVILEDEKVLGLIALAQELTDSRPPCAVVTHLTVLPQLRRHGLGRMLMGLAANDTAERSVWFLAGHVPETEEAQGFAAAIGMKQRAWLAGMPVLDLSDVDGLRYG